jgi:hypothetical protein
MLDKETASFMQYTMICCTGTFLYREVFNSVDHLAACAPIGDWFVNSWEAGASFANESAVRRPTKFGMK